MNIHFLFVSVCVYKKQCNIKKFKIPIKVPRIINRNPRNHCDKAPRIIVRTSLKSHRNYT